MLDEVTPSEYPLSILVVDDQPIILENIRQQLVDDGFHVLSAGCAVDACHLIDERQGGIGAAFLDIDLGAGGDGYSVARHARASHPGMQIVYTSGGVRGGLVHERVAASMFVPKPYVPSDIGALLCEILCLTSVNRGCDAKKIGRLD